MSFANLKSKSMDISKLVAEANAASGQTTNTNKYQDDRKWKPTVDEQGNGYAVIRFLPATEGQDLPWVRYWDHAFKGPTGQWYIERALTTLQNAIKKIDQETRARFKETFDKVNAGLQALFPRVFGGGHAYLDMTGEDLLDTGVAIMARPPGKRNSTIHLLSGGEKAMTAIALVFSIFQLNPSPFCMLDEVDAPLDDANVGRYANLVKEMSKSVQFIFITHNKITMEMANQLLGVTMHEPGVSRIVAVDIEEAAELAAM